MNSRARGRVHVFARAGLPAGISLALLVGVLGGCRTQEAEDAACRQEWADLAQYFGENGNPGTPLTPRLDARWDSQQKRFDSWAKRATAADCRHGAVAREKARTQRIEAVVFGLAPYDVEAIIWRDERDLVHAEKLRGSYDGDATLQSAFADLRSSGAVAKAAFAKPIATIDRIDPDKRSATRDAVAILKRTAADEPAFATFNSAHATIADYELDEE